jgi:hypothetical protein
MRRKAAGFALQFRLLSLLRFSPVVAVAAVGRAARYRAQTTLA